MFDHPFADRLILCRPVDWFNVSLELAHRLSIFTEGIHVTKAGESGIPALQGLDISNLNPSHDYNNVAAKLNCPLWCKVKMSLEPFYGTTISPDLTG